jgi:hypothetical protein
VTAWHPQLGQATDAVHIEADMATRVLLTVNGNPGTAVGAAASGHSGNSDAGADAGGDSGSDGAGRGGAGSGGEQAAGAGAGGAGSRGVVSVNLPYIDAATQVETMLLDPSRPYLYALDRVNNTIKRLLPLDTTVVALSADAHTLYLYDTTSSRIYIQDLSNL